MRFTVWTLVGLGGLGVVLWLVWRWYSKRGPSGALAAVNERGLISGAARLLTGMDGASGSAVRSADTGQGVLAPPTGYTTAPGGSLIRQI